MKYDLSNPLRLEDFKRYVEKLIAEKSVVDLSLHKIPDKRSLNQNRYLHLLISYFAVEYGATKDWVKQMYFKLTVNKDLFLREKDDKMLGRAKYVRSTADLSKEEMTIAIERFRNWSANEAGIYLPSADESEYLDAVQAQINNNRYI